MSKPKVVEVSFVFQGMDALENSEAFMRYIESVDGTWNMLKGIQHFGGRVTYIVNDSGQKMFVIDGDMSDTEGKNDG